METSAPTFWHLLTSGPAGWLFWANVIIWLGIAAYAAFLGRAQNAIERRIRRLEHDLEGENA